MFLLPAAENVSSWRTSVIPGDDGRAPGVVPLTQSYYSCSVFGIQLEKQTSIAPMPINLHLLVTHTREWVVAQFDELCDVLTFALEPKLYDEQFGLDGITHTAPGADDVHRSRPAF